MANVDVRGDYISDKRDDLRSHGTSKGSIDLHDAYEKFDQAEREKDQICGAE